MSAVPNPDPTLEAALTYAARGWRVLPIKPGTKRPPIQAWQDA
ncbi:MAG: bifunctional DNA primase/polymerase, partial [Candidatus Microthrix sp.]|nr:bifunctional DNA primase/polymerase [Candidatus Microthrix sp.]